MINTSKIAEKNRLDFAFKKAIRAINYNPEEEKKTEKEGSVYLKPRNIHKIFAR